MMIQLLRTTVCLALLLALSPIVLKSQDFEPSKYFGGVRGSFSYFSPDFSKLNFSAYTAREMTDKLSLGVNFGYSRGLDSRVNRINDALSLNAMMTNTYSVGIFARQSILKGKRLSLSLETEFGAEFSANNRQDYDPYYAETYKLSIRPVLTYKINRRISLTGSFGGYGASFERLNYQIPNEEPKQIKQLNIGKVNPNFKLGVEFKF